MSLITVNIFIFKNIHTKRLFSCRWCITTIKSIIIHEYQHKSTRVNTNQTSPTRVNTNQHESDTSKHESDTSNTRPTRVNTNQHESKTSLDHKKYGQTKFNCNLSVVFFRKTCGRLHLSMVSVFFSNLLPAITIKNCFFIQVFILQSITLFTAIHCVVRIFPIRTEYGEIRSISPYPVWMWEYADQNNSEYGHFSRSDCNLQQLLCNR